MPSDGIPTYPGGKMDLNDRWVVEVDEHTLFLRYRGIDVCMFTAPEVDAGGGFAESVVQPQYIYDLTSDAENNRHPFVEWPDSRASWDTERVFITQCEAIDALLARIERLNARDTFRKAVQSAQIYRDEGQGNDLEMDRLWEAVNAVRPYLGEIS